MKTIYLLLTRSNTVISGVIHAATGDEYTHISLSMDPQLRSFYSFGRFYPNLPLPAGFIQESLRSGYFGRHCAMPCALYALDVSDASYAAICSQIEEMQSEAGQYRYNLLGLLLCRMKLAHERGKHFFCSQFVARMLQQSGAARLPKAASLMRPMEIAQLSGMRLLYRGALGEAERAVYGGRWAKRLA